MVVTGQPLSLSLAQTEGRGILQVIEFTFKPFFFCASLALPEGEVGGIEEGRRSPQCSILLPELH